VRVKDFPSVQLAGLNYLKINGKGDFENQFSPNISQTIEISRETS
jgi:hypothetical protein